MVWLALWAEARPAPTLPDVLLSHIPYLPWVDRLNYYVLLALYLPIIAAFVISSPYFASRYMVTSGLIALIRGVCIASTGLGPTNGLDIHAGMSADERTRSFLALINPLSTFNSQNGLQVSLTKDMFFSGHTSMTFLLLLYCWRVKSLRVPALLCHVIVVLSVLFAHLHYTIDIIGAYAIVFAVYALREGWQRHTPKPHFAQA